MGCLEIRILLAIYMSLVAYSLVHSILHGDTSSAFQDAQGPTVKQLNTTVSSVLLALDKVQPMDSVNVDDGSVLSSPPQAQLHRQQGQQRENDTATPLTTLTSGGPLIHFRLTGHSGILLSNASCGKDDLREQHFDLDDEGHVEWESADSPANCSLVIDLDPVFGVVVQFHEIRLLLGSSAAMDDTLCVYSGAEFTLVKEVRQTGGDIPVAPLLIRSNKVMIRLVSHGRAPQMGTRNERRQTAKVSLTCTAQVLQTMPPKLAGSRYNCSKPYVVPKALRCDMAKQCLGSEDEMDFNCPYWDPACEDWIPVGGVCVRFVSVDVPVSPDVAERRCHTGNPEGELAHFTFLSERQLAVNITSLMGEDEIITGVFRRRERWARFGYLFRFVWQYSSLKFAYHESDTSMIEPNLECSALRVHPNIHLRSVSCHRPQHRLYACTTHRDELVSFPETPDMEFPALKGSPTGVKPQLRLKKCSDGSYVQPFHPCNVFPRPHVNVNPKRNPHSEVSAAQLPLLRCKHGKLIHYSLACDGHDDCGDNTDETGCVAEPGKHHFLCYKQREIIPMSGRCNGLPDCQDWSDENGCDLCTHGMVSCLGWGCVPQIYVEQERIKCVCVSGDCQGSSSAVREVKRYFSLETQRNLSVSQRLDLDGYGMASLTQIENGHCPETHFQCPEGLCLPSYLVRNGLAHCSFDVEVWPRESCAGYYQCYESYSCLHPDFLCDGIYHCHLRDDERYCNLTCPESCSCEGYAFTCSQMFKLGDYRFVRYLDISGVEQPDLNSLHLVYFLQFLNVSSCSLLSLSLPAAELKVLDVSFNQIKSLLELRFTHIDFRPLTHLNLSGNPILQEFDAHFDPLVRMYVMHDLESLSLADTGIKSISPNNFASLPQLLHLDLRQNRFSFEEYSFQGLNALTDIYTDDSTVCCSYFHLYPESRASCVAPEDELSSCSDLLRSDFYRTILWLLSVLAILGNSSVFVFRVFFETQGTSPGFRILIANLCVSDFLMGVYLITIGSADVRYKGQYVWKREEWTQSAVCQAAGFLAMVSSEMSAFIICIITVDRVLALRFPLKRHLHLKARSTMTVCGAGWLVGSVLAMVPLLANDGDWEFYSQNAICLPLPITLHQFPGKEFAYGIFVVLNFLLFVSIGMGQVFIYFTIRSSSSAVKTKHHRQDTTIARRLFLVVFTDFCCWFPIGLMGLLASRGTPIPSVVNVLSAVLVLPLNSAMNPFLYTLSMLLERRRKRRRETQIQIVLDRLHVQIFAWPEDQLESLFLCVKRAMERVRHEEGRTCGSPEHTGKGLCAPMDVRNEEGHVSFPVTAIASVS